MLIFDICLPAAASLYIVLEVHVLLETIYIACYPHQGISTPVLLFLFYILPLLCNNYYGSPLVILSHSACTAKVL